MTRFVERVARLERTLPSSHAERRHLVMPWDPIPDAADGDLVGLYRTTDNTGAAHLDFERNGIHPRDDAPGSHNHRMYFEGMPNG